MPSNHSTAAASHAEAVQDGDNEQGEQGGEGQTPDDGGGHRAPEQRFAAQAGSQ